MAVFKIGTSHGMRQTLIEQELFRDTVVNSVFLNTFAPQAAKDWLNGTGWKGNVYEGVPNSVVHVKANLGLRGQGRGVTKGDKETFGLAARIDPKVHPGVTGDKRAKGTEIDGTVYTDSVTLQRYRMPISGGDYMTWQRAGFNVDALTKGLITTWGQEKMDLLCLEALEDTTTISEIMYKTGDDPANYVSSNSSLSTAKTALSLANSKITPKFISYLKAWALTGGGRTGGKCPIRPVMYKGRPYYIVLVHSDAVFDWKHDSTYFQAAREAEVRGAENPIFTGSDYIMDGMVIFICEQITKGTDGGGASVPWCWGHLLGAQALLWTWGENPSIVADEDDDYAEQVNYCWRMTTAVKAPYFNSKRYGSLSFLVSRTNISG